MFENPGGDLRLEAPTFIIISLDNKDNSIGSRQFNGNDMGLKVGICKVPKTEAKCSTFRLINKFIHAAVNFLQSLTYSYQKSASVFHIFLFFKRLLMNFNIMLRPLKEECKEIHMDSNIFLSC